MPKQKTHAGLKKRIKITGAKKMVRGHAYTGHLKTNKSHKQNVALRKKAVVTDTDYKRIKPLISDML